MLGQRRNEIVDGLEAVARRLDCSLVELALAWIVANPKVSTAGVTSPAQLVGNLEALKIVPRLTPELMSEMAATVGDYSEPWSTVTDPL